MYQVIKMYGDCEPWWFLEGWEEDIVHTERFERYEDALLYYQTECDQLAQCLPQKKAETELMVAYWDPADVAWCEECEEQLQQYHSVFLMETKALSLMGVSSFSTGKRIRPCQIRK